jgi:predicted metal-dependent HD superfamily phosphohydrolase
VEIARTRWFDFFRRIGGSLDPAPLYEDLARRYGEAARAYHTLQHIVECLQELDRVRPLPPEVELALWYHDAVYDPRAHDNEERSAELAREVARRLGWSDAVHDLILATKHDAAPADEGARWVTDIDLSILGQAQPRFDQYERQIRTEYAFVPEELFHRKRREILRSLLARPFLYQTAFFRERYEAAARANLDRVLR